MNNKLYFISDLEIKKAFIKVISNQNICSLEIVVKKFYILVKNCLKLIQSFLKNTSLSGNQLYCWSAAFNFDYQYKYCRSCY